jgi:serine/threonine-protein kinase
MVGTPSHMAPEQFLGRPMDRRVDIYGAGVVLYQLLTGRAPFAGTTEALMYKVVNEMPQPPSTIEGAERPAGSTPSLPGPSPSVPTIASRARRTSSRP